MQRSKDDIYMLYPAARRGCRRGMGLRLTAEGSPPETAEFHLNPGVVVFDDSGKPVVPGSSPVGMAASANSNVPLGYYKNRCTTSGSANAW